MKQKLLLKAMLLLCALIVGSSSVWAQSDYSALYSSNVTLSTSGGTSASTAKVKVQSTDAGYGALKAGTSSNAGAVKITVPSGAKYLHLHVAAWNNESVTLTVKQGTTTVTTISLTSDSGISGSSTTYTLGTPANATTNYYKVITFASALTANTDYTITATSGKRFVIWGVNSEAESNDPSSNAAFTNTTPEITYPATKTYSQAPTTAAGYTGTISYSMIANTAGATINSSTGVVTVTKGGSVTVKALAAAVPGSFSGSEATYTLTVNDTRTSAGLSWSAASADVTYGANNNIFPTLTNTHSVPVTYTSSNQAAATIDENTGAITLKDYTGSTDISAIFAGNDDYFAQTVKYTLNVTKAPFAIKDGVFDFVEAAAADEDYGSGVSPTKDGNYYEPDDATWTAGNVTMVTSGKYRWWYSNSGCDLRFQNNTTYSSATFSVPAGYAITKIVTTGGNFVSANTGNLSGANWTGASQSVKLSISTSTVNIKTITVTYGTTVPVKLNASGYATFAANTPLDFSDDSEFSAWQITGVSGSTITFSQITGAVKAGTGVLLKGTASDEISIPVVASGTDISGTNQLVGITSPTAVVADTYYGLSGSTFKKVNAGTVPAGKALLPVGAVSVKAFVFDFGGDADGIQTLSDSPLKGENIYNLAGQRLQKMQKGINIVNGKKVLY